MIFKWINFFYKFSLSFTLILFQCNFNSAIESNEMQQEPPLLLLISFDGFRWDYLKKHHLKNFEYLKSIGSHANFIYNSFATVTFPNHWSLVTGLNEESHGIIQNSMFDPILNKSFAASNLNDQSIEWFGQNKETQPIWTVNQKAGQGRKSAAEWIGSQVIFSNETQTYIPYNHSTPYKEYIDTFIQLFTNKPHPINFGALYFDEPDHTGHLFGPDSVDMESKLFELDQHLEYLIRELKRHDIFEKINIIITSDHGMETIKGKENAIFLDKYVNTSLFEAYGSSAVYDLFLKNVSNLQDTYEKLKKVENMDIYKKEDIPKTLNYRKNVRTGDLLLVARLGYVIFLNSSESINWEWIRGTHGYYNNQSSMHPIFIGTGPRFKKNFIIEPFRNVDIYPLMCYILNVEPSPNNGSLQIVKMMIIEKSLDLYVFLSIVPIFLATACAIILCIINKKAKLPGQASAQNDGYTIVSTSETNELINQKEDDEMSDINSNHNNSTLV